MNEPETQAEPTQDFAIEDLREEIQSLRTLMSVSLMVLIVFSFCVNWYLYRQTSMARGRIRQDTQNATAVQQRAVEIWAELNKYGKTHADFNALLEKYRPYFVAGPSAQPTAPTAAPAVVKPK